MRRSCVALLCVALSAATVLAGCGDGRGDCMAGQRDCACTSLGTCSDGLDCHQNMCVRPRERTVQILSSDARACEFVVVDGSTRLTSVRFDESVRGASVRRGSRTAVTVVSVGDYPIGTGVTLGYQDGDEPLAVEQSTCFDRQGESLGGALVRL